VYDHQSLPDNIAHFAQGYDYIIDKPEIKMVYGD
jgi:hypothetical protein